MARPKRGNYAYGAEGLKRYKAALKEYLKKQRKVNAEKNKLSTESNIKEQVDKNKKATAKTKNKIKTKTKVKSTVNKGKNLGTGNKGKVTNKVKTTANQVKTNKPLITEATKLKIKKNLGKVVTNAKNIPGKTIKTSKSLVNQIQDKVKPYKDNLKKFKANKPTTRLQKIAAKGNQVLKNVGKYTKNQVLPKAKKDLVKFGKDLVNPKNFGRNIKGLKGLGVSFVLNAAADNLSTRLSKSLNPRYKDKSLAEYKADLEKFKKEQREKYGILPNTGRLIKYIGKKVFSKKDNKNNNNNKLKVNKTNNNTNNNTNKDKQNTTVKPIVKSVGKTDFNVATKDGLAAYNKALKANKTNNNKVTKTKSKFIRTSKGTLARRGTVTARRAENKERAKERAKEMARRRLANK